MSRIKSVSDINSFGGRLRAFRKDKNLTQQGLAESIGLSQNFLSQVESDKESLTKPALLLLNNLYRINREWLLTGEEPMYLASAGADRAADPGVDYGLDETMGMIINLSRELSEEGRRDVLEYIKKIGPHFAALNMVRRMPRPIPIDFNADQRLALQLYEMAEQMGLAKNLDEIAERLIADAYRERRKKPEKRG